MFSELLEEKRDLFTGIMMDAIEEIGLANAIREGRQNEFVSEDQVIKPILPPIRRGAGGGSTLVCSYGCGRR